VIADQLGQRGALGGFVPRKGLDAGMVRGWTPAELGAVVREALAGATGPLVVEVGAWCGRSTIAIGEAVRERGGELVVVDTWLGSPEFWLEDRGKATHDLRIVDGYPTVYREWAQNVVDAGLQATVTPFPISSREGARVLRTLQASAALVYLDGAHEEDAVLSDLRAWWPVVAPGGILLGDDMSERWPGVRAAVDWFAMELADHAGLRVPRTRFVEHGGGLWSLSRPR